MRRAPLRRSPLLSAVTAAAVLLAGCGTSVTTEARRLGVPRPLPSVSAAGGNTDGTSTPVADPIYPGYGNPAIDVQHYGLTLAWAPDTKTLTGTATIKLRAVRAVQQVRLDFSSAYRIGKTSIDGADVAGRIVEGDLTVDRPLAAGAVATLAVEYQGTPATVPMPSHRGDSEPLGLTVTKDGELWTMQEPYGASTWYPANDQPSDKALYDIAVTVPAGWAGVASGTPKGRSGDTFSYTTAQPVASYLTTLAVGRYTKSEVTGPRGLPITLWTRTGKDDAFIPELKKSPEYLGWLEERFGPHPFPSTGAVIVPSESAMETQQMLTIGGDVLGPRPQLDNLGPVLVHEYAHQWFGNAVGPATWKDLWLNEGWATYVEQLHNASHGGPAIERWEQAARQQDTELRRRLGPPGSPRADSFAEGNVYLCPALMLRQLHKALGDERFFALGRAWAGGHAGTAQDRAAFIAFVNQQTGRDFTGLINSWLDSPATPA
ncbi:M1 family metallopeptidase [Dactylosporangium fulvum]|uniref:Aminopeptidase N n=1 Tax=Dactylosporangium fulvum TaxID=53359 RepID=A0ABY5WAV1_9ACTN|nr:M1 family metallopeptidase [Dactylosporangium fulvum]UWP86144.1 M1 family metallopeptidase [Dactylosporangium fulvum]